MLGRATYVGRRVGVSAWEVSMNCSGFSTSNLGPRGPPSSDLWDLFQP